MLEPLKVYSDRKFLPSGLPHVPLLYPFWGPNWEDPDDPSTGRFDFWMNHGKSVFELTSLPEAQIAILPGAWEVITRQKEALALALQFIQVALKANRRTLIFFCSDSDEKIPIDSAVVFRTSFYASRKEVNEFAMPAWTEDIIERYLDCELPLRPYGMVPRVSFCGLAEPFRRSIPAKLRRSLRRALGEPDFDQRSGQSIRTRAMLRLASDRRVKTDFILRKEFHGGMLEPHRDKTYIETKRLEYVNNMLNSDYVLCVRGAGNFSYRLYETLCCGRVPLFINTDCVLPFDDEIDWKRYCVWVEEDEIDEIGDKVYKFHSQLTENEFASMQRASRRLWEDRLSPAGFFSSLRYQLPNLTRNMGPTP